MNRSQPIAHYSQPESEELLMRMGSLPFFYLGYLGRSLKCFFAPLR